MKVMHFGRFIAGAICFGLAVPMLILTWVLPAGQVMFMSNGENKPWIPVIGLGVLGIVLLTSAGIGRQPAETSAPHAEGVVDPQKAALNKRLETIALGCYLVLMGGFALVPRTTISAGFWSIAAGLVFLGLNAARYFNHMKMSGFTTFLGILSVIGGVAQLAGLRVIEGAFFLIVLGAALLLKPWFDKRQLFGKAEES